jgi:hypothetical protein
MDFAKIVLDRLNELGLNVNQAEARFGFPQGYIRGVVREDAKRASPGIDKAEAIARALGLNVQLGARRSGPIGVLDLDGADFARIPLHDAWLSAGPGVENGDVAIIDHLVFRQEWLRKIDVKPEAAAMARVSGDSMAPGIQSGDLVMIDTTRKDVPVHRKHRSPGSLPIFAFIQDGEARVKRLERRPKEKILVLYSDNRDMPPELIAESDAHVLNILGQVVWSGHVWR